jgi:hypothetical protein
MVAFMFPTATSNTVIRRRKSKRKLLHENVLLGMVDMSADLGSKTEVGSKTERLRSSST